MRGVRAVDRIVEVCERDLAFIWLTKGQKPKRDAFYEFNSWFSFEKKYKDYQLLACDGSDLNIARNPNDAGTYFQSQPTAVSYTHLDVYKRQGSRCKRVQVSWMYLCRTGFTTPRRSLYRSIRRTCRQQLHKRGDSRNGSN